MTQGRVVYNRLQNKQGNSLASGSVVILDTGNDSAFKTTVTGSDLRVIGVTAHAFDIDEIGLVQVDGIITALVDGAVVRGHWLVTGTTVGQLHDSGTLAAAGASPPSGAIAIALVAASGAGSISVMLIPVSSGSGGSGAPTSSKYYTQASDAGLSAELVLSNLGNYNPDNRPASPSATDDEFDAGSLDVSWTSESPAVLDVNTHGFVHIVENTGLVKGIWKAFVPGAATFTVAVKVYGDVIKTSSQQVLLTLANSSGTPIVAIGMLNGAAWICKATALGGGFSTGGIAGAGDLGVHYFSIQRSAGTAYLVYVSSDGIIWNQVASFSQAGTVARVYLQVYGDVGSAEAYFDFVRMLTSQTNVIGTNP